MKLEDIEEENETRKSKFPQELKIFKIRMRTNYLRGKYEKLRRDFFTKIGRMLMKESDNIKRKEHEKSHVNHDRLEALRTRLEYREYGSEYLNPESEYND